MPVYKLARRFNLSEHHADTFHPRAWYFLFRTRALNFATGVDSLARDFTTKRRKAEMSTRRGSRPLHSFSLNDTSDRISVKKMRPPSSPQNLPKSINGLARRINWHVACVSAWAACPRC